MDRRTAMQLSIRLNKIGETLREKNERYNENMVTFFVDMLETALQRFESKRDEAAFCDFNDEEFEI